jgi:hypothetical protein
MPGEDRRELNGFSFKGLAVIHGKGQDHGQVSYTNSNLKGRENGDE